VRDGYAGYEHLTDALHAWCGAHLLRDLKGLYDFEPDKQAWASQMACLLIEARDAAAAARHAGQSALETATLDGLVTRYRELAAAGLAANLYRRTATAQDARRIARWFLTFEDLILRFATRPDLDIFTNNEAERTICFAGIAKPVAVIGPGPAQDVRRSSQPYGPPPFPGVRGLIEHSYAGLAATLTAWAVTQADLHNLIDTREISGAGAEPVTVLDDGEVTVRAIVVPHLPTSYAYRIDTSAGSVVFSGDTGPSQAVASLARGADVLVHEVMDIDAMIAEGMPAELAEVFRAVHTEVSDVGPIAAQAGVPVLALNHFAPAAGPADPQRWMRRISQDYDGRVFVAQDLMTIPVRRGRANPGTRLAGGGK